MDAWPIDWPASIDVTTLDPDAVALAEKYAAATLRFLTLNRVGGTPITVMPCGRTCRAPLMRSSMFMPVLFPSYFLASAQDLRSCGCSLGCICSQVKYVLLEAPVGRIDEVKVGGVVLDPSTYHVEDGNKLVRNDGSLWPACGGRDFTVTYLNGYEVDSMGQFVGGLLAEEFIKALTSDKKCRLPSTITTMARQGISYQLTRGMFVDGVTGIPEVDAYVVLWNPAGLRVRPAVYSPDLPTQRHITFGSW
jgi:hypothetical protein